MGILKVLNYFADVPFDGSNVTSFEDVKFKQPDTFEDVSFDLSKLNKFEDVPLNPFK